jgi:hypothetical protein
LSHRRGTKPIGVYALIEETIDPITLGKLMRRVIIVARNKQAAAEKTARKDAYLLRPAKEDEVLKFRHLPFGTVIRSRWRPYAQLEHYFQLPLNS